METTDTATDAATITNVEHPEDAASTEPASTEPASTEPASTEPASTEPASTEPASTEPAKGAGDTPAESSATKVRIDTPGVTVDIEAHEPLAVVAATAIRLFNEAGGWPQDRSRAAGFVHVERRDSPPAQASSMEWAPGSYPVQMP